MVKVHLYATSLFSSSKMTPHNTSFLTSLFRHTESRDLKDAIDWSQNDLDDKIHRQYTLTRNRCSTLIGRVYNYLNIENPIDDALVRQQNELRNSTRREKKPVQNSKRGERGNRTGDLRIMKRVR